MTKKKEYKIPEIIVVELDDMLMEGSIPVDIDRENPDIDEGDLGEDGDFELN